MHVYLSIYESICAYMNTDLHTHICINTQLCLQPCIHTDHFRYHEHVSVIWILLLINEGTSYVFRKSVYWKYCSERDVADVTASFSVDTILIFESIFVFIFFVKKKYTQIYFHTSEYFLTTNLMSQRFN